MLFNSLEFLVLFLPAAVALAALARRSPWPRLELSVLALLSLAFYAASGLQFGLLLLASVCVNYWLAGRIRAASNRARVMLTVAAGALNVGLLGYFKYWNFLAGQINLLGAGLDVTTIVLPVGISFYTFQQIAYLVDNCKGRPAGTGFVDYVLFVTFFPQLIAGPIVHHSEMMPQFYRRAGGREDDLAGGLTIFTIGLAKKIFLADKVAAFSSPVFDVAAAQPPQFVPAWLAALCYALQIYFDFSAYSDMAIGLGRMFGIRLPYNFASPYRATSIIEFWRRWHITLSRFLRDYVYIPLGGSRSGPRRRYANIFLTMLIGGIWHGAGWNFLFWGALHGALLVGNHAVRAVCPRRRFPPALGWLLTFVAVTVAWVPFRAESQAAWMAMWGGMAGLNGGLPALASFDLAGILRSYLVFKVDRSVPEFWLPVALALALLAPNTQQIMRGTIPGLRTFGYPSPFLVQGFWPEIVQIAWKCTLWTALLTATVLASCIISLRNVSEFIYFRF